MSGSGERAPAGHATDDAAGAGRPREVVVVPHTHWDREWYEPFQTFRLKLVDLVDGLLPLLESDPSYRHFMLDGQMAVVDDYLAIRPDQEQRLRSLAAAGRLAVGPWYILMDEFLVSGETIVRDLQRGLDRAAAFGGATPVGYLPDMFGHIAQMPQLLLQFGLGDAVVWRGVPAAVDRGAFWWEAPDGSRVRAELLADGYGNGATLPDDAKALVAQVERFVSEHPELLDGPILWMNGTDHQMPRPWLGRVVEEANALGGDWAFRVGSLRSYLDAAPTEGLAHWRGELRSGARANLLMGVVSNRVDVRRAAADAERAIEQTAEPLAALLLPPERWPAAFLDEAWTALVRNAAHDSVCACSVDEVCDAVLVRYAEARQIGEGLTDRSIAALAADLSEVGAFVVNPSARTRSGLVELRVPGHGDHDAVQVLRRSGGARASEGMTRRDVGLLAQGALDNVATIARAEVVTGDDGVLEVLLHHDRSHRGHRDDTAVRGELRAAVEDAPDGPARLVVSSPPTQRVLVHVHAVGGFGWARWELDPLDVDPVHVAEKGRGDAEGVTISNGIVTVVVDPDDGTFSLTDGERTTGDRMPDAGPARTARGLGRLVDEGDAGDTYNYNPPPQDRAVDAPDRVTVEVLEAGPLRARVAVGRQYRWPEAVVDGARVGEVTVDTVTTIEVQAGSPLVRVTTALENRARDHRLRLVLPLPEPARTSRAECAFAVVERGLEAEGGPTERALATYPSRRFVIAGGLTVVHDRILEHELVERGSGPDRSGATESGRGDPEAPAHALALTLLRATGIISQGPMAFRPMPAGPPDPAPGAQVPGPHEWRWGVQLGDDVDDAYAAAEDAFVPLVVGYATGGGARPASGRVLEVDGAAVSSLVRDGRELVLRVFNPHDEPSTLTVAGRRGWLTDLRGRPVEPFEERLTLAPWRIATLRLTDAP
jgi:hypothetical protein